MLQCPLCSFSDEDDYALTLHVEVAHFADDSPFVARESLTLPPQKTASEKEPSERETNHVEECEEASQNSISHNATCDDTRSDDEYLPCPEDCGEEVLWRDLQEHLDFHLAERLGLDDRSEDPSTSLVSPGADMYEPVPYLYPATFVRVQTFPMAFRDCPSHNLSQSLFAEIPWFRNYAEYLSWLYYDANTFAYLPSLNLSLPWSHPQQSSNTSREKSSLTRRAITQASQSTPQRHPTRLGKRELGPYAFEGRMPKWLYEQLLHGGKRTTTQHISSSGQLFVTSSVDNEVRGILPVIAGLLQEDPGVGEAWLCHPTIQHVFKMPKEGGFCGYRNIQMAMSFILGTRCRGFGTLKDVSRSFGKKSEDEILGVLDLQSVIERAWDLGHNAHGRVETGGIRGTRKYIGTPEFQAVLDYLAIPHETFQFTDRILHSDSNARYQAHEQLLDQVQQYFSSFTGPAPTPVPSASSTQTESESLPSTKARIHHTLLPPIFLQQPGHSLTIVGLEIRANGARNLLVFDPAFQPSAGIYKLLQSKRSSISSSPRSKSVLTKPKPSSSASRSSALTSDGDIRGWVRRKDTSSSSTSGSGSAGRSPSDIDKHANDKRIQACRLLSAYRRGPDRIGKHKEFELIMLDPVELLQSTEAENLPTGWADISTRSQSF